MAKWSKQEQPTLCVETAVRNRADYRHLRSVLGFLGRSEQHRDTLEAVRVANPGATSSSHTGVFR